MTKQSVLIFNAKIWTDDGLKTWMSVHQNKIYRIGDDKDKPEWDGISLDMAGNFILPGLQDAHLHVFSLGQSEYRLQLEKPRSIAEMQNKLDEYIFENKQNDNWIVGYGWDQDYMEDKRYPSKFDLDLIVKDRPIVLFRSCYHIAVVNTKALEILKINKDSSDPEGGEIDRNNNGEPNGILREKALDIITTHIKIHDKNTKKKIIEIGLQKCLNVGLTGVQTNDSEAWEIYKELEREGKLPIRVYLTINYQELIDKECPQPNSRVGLLSCDRVKLFADGSLGAQTAALREPYSDTGKIGITIYSQDELNERVKKIKESGFRIEIHGIGDLAINNILNAFDYANITKDDRAIITHCQVLGTDLLDRMHNMGIIANIQPPFVTTDSKWVEKRLGMSERLKFAYAWKSIIDRGIDVCGGSDAPIESPNPLLGMYSALFRKDPNNKTWMPQEKLSFKEALFLYSEGAAYAAKEETTNGRLTPGYKADFIVVDQNVESNPELLKKAQILQVWVDGIRRL